jgi:2-polyprenyl-6-methoxyphenol hydroxylase-like FAD-dependent oxidoreductase
MALEDACVLSAAIARHANDLDEALLAYERARTPRARAAASLATRGACAAADEDPAHRRVVAQSAGNVRGVAATVFGTSATSRARMSRSSFDGPKASLTSWPNWPQISCGLRAT